MTNKHRLPRTVRGKRPEMFEAAGVDDAFAMITVLAQELQVLRERLDSAEHVMKAHGIDLAAEIEALPLSEEMLKAREEARQLFLGRLFFLQQQRRSEMEEKFSASSYLETLEKVAQGDI